MLCQVPTEDGDLRFEPVPNAAQASVTIVKRVIPSNI